MNRAAGLARRLSKIIQKHPTRVLINNCQLTAKKAVYSFPCVKCLEYWETRIVIKTKTAQ